MQQKDAEKKPGIHGGDIIATARSLRCRIADLVDMSGNLTPMGTDRSLLDFLSGHLEEIGYLPETASEELRSAFASQYNRTSSEVLAGSGTTEFIFSIPQAVSPQRALIIAPSYSDYQAACQMAAVPVELFFLEAAKSFRLDFDRLHAAIRPDDLVFICNPNNPTGQLAPSSTLHDLAAQHPEAAFVIDESYIAFCEERSMLYQPPLDNLFVLSSFSKAYGIPGLRLGFLSCSSRYLRTMQRSGRPWGVNRLAQLAGLYLLQHGKDIQAELLSFVARERPKFFQALGKLPGVTPIKSAANFILSRLEGPVDAEQLRRGLLEKRIMIRNCANFAGLDDLYFRVCLRPPEENERFLNEIRAIVTP